MRKKPTIVWIINLPRHIATHLHGDEHTPAHRMSYGAVVMFVGVGIAKSAHYVDPVAGFLLDVLGYAVHGAGALPFIEHFIDGDK